MQGPNISVFEVDPPRLPYQDKKWTNKTPRPLVGGYSTPDYIFMN